MTGLRNAARRRAPLSCTGVIFVALLLAGCTSKSATTGKASNGTVRFRSSDGLLLEGELSGEGDAAVVLAHMFGGDRSAWDGYADELDDTYRVLRFDFRGYGDSEGTKQVGLIDRDVKAAVAFMRAQGASKVVVIGASMGGTAALVAAGDTKVDGVAAISAPADFRGLDASTAVSKVEARMLFIACTEDADAAASAKSLYRAALDPASDLRLFACPDHGTDIFRGARGEEVAKVVEGFLSEVM